MLKRRICAALLALTMIATSAAMSASAADLTPNAQNGSRAATTLPAIDGLVCRDEANASAWSIKSGLAVGDKVYGDSDIKFTKISDELLGSYWIQTADASKDYSDKYTMAEFTANASGELYIALPDGSKKPDWMEDYSESNLSVEADKVKFTLYKLHLENGTTIRLKSIAGEHNFMAIYKTGVIDSAPPMPNVTQYLTGRWDATWFRMDSNLQLGTCIYTIDSDPTKTEKDTYNTADYLLSEVPEKFIGADYIISRVTGAQPDQNHHFFAEQEIDIYAAVDSVNTNIPSSLNGWAKTGETMKIANGTVYYLVKKTFPAEEVVLLSKYNGQGNNVFYMILPTEGETVANALTNNPVIPEGQKPEKNEADKAYRYYLNDVFNMDTAEGVPTGYTGSSAALSEAGFTIETKTYKEGQNIALNAPYTYNTISYTGSPVDGDFNTYWQSDGFPGWLQIDLQAETRINKVVLKLRDYWGDRTQNIEIQTSSDGITFKTVVAAHDCLFEQSKTNIVEFPIEETSTRYVRVIGNSNTGQAGKFQMAEIELYGPEQTLTITSEGERNRYAILSTEDAASDKAVMTKTFDDAVTGKVIFEGKFKSSEDNQSMSIPVMKSSDGKTAIDLTFGENGYIMAGDTEVAPYTADTWYTIKMLIDIDAGTYEVWVDHIRKVQDVEFSSAAKDIKTLTFSVNKYGELDVDNLRLYDNTEIYAVDDTFDDIEAGKLPENWEFSSTRRSSVEEVPFKEVKSLMIENNGNATQAVRSFDPISGDVTISAKVKPMTSGWVSMPVVYDSKGEVAIKVAFYRNSFYINNGDNWVYVCSQEVPNNYYPAGNWFQIKLILNTYTNRYDFYVDGARRYSGASFANDVDDVASVSFNAEEKNTVYIDSLQIFDSASLARGLYPQENVFNVKDYGAKGDGVTDDTNAIAKAINAAAYTGGTVVLENGVFYCGQITMETDMTLFLDASATIFSKQNRNDYIKFIPERDGVVGYNANHQLGRGIIRSLDGANNFRITGGGTIDANGFYAFNENDPGNQRPCTMYLTESKDIYIDSINMVTAQHWTLVPYESDNITIRNVAITNHVAPNRDGIDPVNCSNMTIENCYIIAGDDAFCPKSGDSVPSVNCDVRNVFMQSYCNGIKFGTDSYDDFRNYHFEDIWMKCVGLSGITLQAVDGSDIDNITFKRIDMIDVDNVLAFMVGDRKRANAGLENKLGSISNIVIEDLNYTDPMMPPFSHQNEKVHEAMIVGLDPARGETPANQHRISNILFKNVYMEMPGGFTTVPDWPGGIGREYPEHGGMGGNSRGSFYTIRWADNIQFENCTNVLLEDDVRKEIAYDDNTCSAGAVTVAQKAKFVIGNADLTVKIGTEKADLDLPKTAKVVLENNKVAELDITSWSGDYDANTPGTYTFTANLPADASIITNGTLTTSIDVIVTDKTVIKGDLTNDGKVTVSDILALKTIIMSGKAPTAEQLEIADLNASPDGKLTVSDILGIKAIIMG